MGAALPILGTLRSLRASGDRVQAIRGALSGTLSYVFHELNRGIPFSEAVRRAREEGFTEPHPGEDLSGADVARKLLILAREAGWLVEGDTIRMESLVPPELARENDPERFMAGLAAHDEAWSRRILNGGKDKLAYLAVFRAGTGMVGVQSLGASDPLATLLPTENRIIVETARYRDVSLAISGPGAGREVTAAGVLADLLGATGAVGQKLARLLSGRPWLRVTALAASARSRGRPYGDAVR